MALIGENEKASREATDLVARAMGALAEAETSLEGIDPTAAQAIKEMGESLDPILQLLSARVEKLYELRQERERKAREEKPHG